MTVGLPLEKYLQNARRALERLAKLLDAEPLTDQQRGFALEILGQIEEMTRDLHERVEEE